MNPFVSQTAIQIIITLIQSMMDNGLVAKIQDLVIVAFDLDMPGEQKKIAVMHELNRVTGTLGTAFAATAPWLINMLIEAIVGKYKIDNE